MERMRSDPTDLEEDDPALAGRVLHGDEAAFRALYRRHTPALYQFVLRLLAGDEREAEDVVQDTWIRAVQALSRFRWEAGLRTWLSGIALNRVRELLRREGRSPWSEPAGDEPALPPPGIGERVDLEAAIRLLPGGYRTVLVLHDVYGFTHEEIGERLEITPGTSRSQLHFARKALRRHFDAGEGDERRRADA